MKTLATLNVGLQSIITTLQKQKDELYQNYSSAIKNGAKYENIKNLYLSLKDVDIKLRDLLRSDFTAATIG